MDKFYLYKSDKPKKKYYVEFVNPETSRLKRIYFGAAGMSDYILSGGDDEKKARYIARHQKREDWSSPFAGAGVWSRFLLWGERSLAKSIKAMQDKFNIKIINRTKSKSAGEKYSAYRSMRLASQGKTRPTNKANRGALLDWSRERWENLTARLTDGDKFYDCGTKGKKQKEKGLPSVCRPSIRVNKKTPRLAKEFSEKQIRKAIEIKKKGKRINWKEL
jgi:hypothetical protein